MPIYQFTAYNHKGRKISGEYTAKDEQHLARELNKMGMDLRSAQLRKDRHPFSLWDLWDGPANALEGLFRFLLPTPKTHYDPKNYIRTRKARADIRARIAKGNTDAMPTFFYDARSKIGGTVSGEMEARDVEDLAARLQLLELTLVRVNAAPIDLPTHRFRAKRLPSTELLILARQLETYFKLDMIVPQMLDAIRQTCGSRNLKALLWQLSDHMRHGDNLAQAMAHYPKAFGRFFLGVVNTGQRTGTFPLVFHYAAQHLAWLINFRRKVIKGLRWPLFTCLVTWGFFATKAMALFLIPCALYMLVRSTRNQLPRFAIAIDRTLLTIPYLGHLWQRYDTLNFLYMFGVMWRAGLPIDEILQQAQKLMYNYALRETVDHIAAEVDFGERLSKAFATSGLFPPFIIAAVAQGEQTGSFELSLDEVYYFYTRELNDAAFYLIQWLYYSMLFTAAIPLLRYGLMRSGF